METEATMQIHHKTTTIEATGCNFSGSVFRDVSLAAATFEDVNLGSATFNNANLSGWKVQDATLARLDIRDSDLRGAAIVDCLTEGMTIDGIPVAAMLAAYRKAQS